MAPKSVKELFESRKIYQIVNSKVVQASPDISIDEAVRLMRKRKSGYVILAKKKKVCGIFTETDLVRKILGQDVPWDKPVGEFMTPNPAVLSPHDLVGKAIELMGTQRFYHLPLVNEKGELAGVLSVRCLIRFFSGFYPTEIYNLPPNPDQIIQTPEGG